MAQPGNFTPILLYGSSTPGNVPLAANLTNSATGSEIALNVADKNLFFKDSGGTVNTVPIRQSSTSSNGWLSATDWNTFNNKSNTNGTVTSVAALTLGTTGTDLSSTVANGTTTPVITLNVPTASAANRGALSAADWSTFNSKAPGVTFTTGYVPFGQGSTTLNQSSALTFDGTNLAVTGNVAAPVVIGVSNASASTSAGTKLSFKFGGTETGYILNQFNGSDFKMDFATNDYFRWLIGASEKMRLFNSGGVSIGNTTDPGATNLSVTGTITSASTVQSSKTTSGQVTNFGNGRFTVIDRRTSLLAVNFLQIDLNANGGTAIISVVCAAQFSGIDNGATVKTWFVSRYGSGAVTITEKLAQNSGVANFITCTSSGNYIILAYTQPGVLTNYFDTFVDILAVGTTNGTTPANVVVTTL